MGMEALVLLCECPAHVLTADRVAATLHALSGAPDSRQERRRPEAKLRASKAHALVGRLAEAFTDAATLCDERRACVAPLREVMKKVLASARVVGEGQRRADGAAVLSRAQYEQLGANIMTDWQLLMNGQAAVCLHETPSLKRYEQLGANMPDWDSEYLCRMCDNVMKLARLATCVNRRVRACFGGNFPALVWLEEPFEFDPENANKDMALLHKNEASLTEAVEVLRHLLATLPASPELPEPPSAPDSTDGSGATPPPPPLASLANAKLPPKKAKKKKNR